MDIVVSLKNRCARREYCSADILRKLKNAGVTGEKAVEILQELREGKWVDDVRYAACYAREKASVAGWGPVKIKYHLALKGIAPEAVTEAVKEIDVRRAAQRKTDVMEAKWREICRRETDVMRRKARLLRFALGRGYSAEDVSAVMKIND